MAIRLNRADALNLWHGVMLDGVTSSNPDLSARQIVILTSVYLHDGPHTVRSLASTLGVTKAVVTRALDTLQGYGYLVRADDPLDGRSVVIHRTPAGSTYLTQLGDAITQTLKIVQLKGEGKMATPTHAPSARTNGYAATRSELGVGVN